MIFYRYLYHPLFHINILITSLAYSEIILSCDNGKEPDKKATARKTPHEIDRLNLKRCKVKKLTN